MDGWRISELILANLAVHSEDSVTIRKKKKWKVIITRPLYVREMKTAAGRARLGIRSNSFNILVKLRWIVFLRKLTIKSMLLILYSSLSPVLLYVYVTGESLKKFRLKVFNLGSRF